MPVSHLFKKRKLIDSGVKNPDGLAMLCYAARRAFRRACFLIDVSIPYTDANSISTALCWRAAVSKATHNKQGALVEGASRNIPEIYL